MSDNLNKKRILVLGGGFMSREYVKVLAGLKHDVTVVGRGAQKINRLKDEFPQFTFHTGGIEKFFRDNTRNYDYAINAVNISFLKSTTLTLLENGVKFILLEKPGDLSVGGLTELKKMADYKGAKICIAYNRRFYASFKTLLKETEADGGIKSVHFEFTEWVNTIAHEQYDAEALKKWIISNSSHVIDIVFAITGRPREIHAIVSGENKIDWHPSGSLFVGSGIGMSGIPFTYHANWESAGRWSIEVLTKNRRFYLKPMEKLLVQIKDTISITELPIDDDLDQKFKPGLYHQVFEFIENNYANLVSLEEQILILPFYYKIGGYN